MSAKIGTEANPLRVAIVGAGPAGFYAADRLLRTEGVSAQVEMLERLPTPHGLVRAGVAPDHPKIKSVTRVYDKTAVLPGFRFFGNVELGRDVSAAEVAERCHAVIYAVGAQTDRRLGIPGEDLPGSHPATDFVAWYNAHPDYAEHDFDLACERAVVVGNGNVAMDVARMLALDHSELTVTDIADHALDVLEHSAVREIEVLGRRGPAQAAFTNPELREFGELHGADVIVDPADLELDELNREFLESEADATARKNVELLGDLAARPPAGKPRRILMRFCVSPIEIRGEGRVEEVVIARNELYRDQSGALRARQTEATETVEAGLVLRSIGYLGVPLPGVPFDERRGVIANQGGRILEPDGGEPLPGQYVVGWIKRGPSGVIGTNKKDAYETVAHLLDDLAAGKLPEAGDDPDALLELLHERAGDHVTFAGWEAIDAVERERGEPAGRPRVKFTRVDEMLEVSSTRAPAR